MSNVSTPPPDEPGEIGWPANASAPGDPSIPKKGSGGAKVENLVDPATGVVVLPKPEQGPKSQQ